MARYIHRPECYLANERGMVEVNDDYYQWLYMTETDNRAIIGNRVVEFRFNSDTMEPTKHMVNGKYYTSKKKFRDETRARGCIEIGNEEKFIVNRANKAAEKRRNQLSSKKDKRQRREDIKRAIYEVKNGRNIINEIRNLPKD